MKVSKRVERLLRQGHKPKELKERFPSRIVTRVYRRLKKEKAAARGKKLEGAPQAETQLEIPPEPPETISTIWQRLQSMANDLQRIESIIQALPEVAVLIAAAREFGTYKRDTCPYQKEALCTLRTWSSEGDIPPGIGEPVAPADEKGEWCIKPSPLYCTLCPMPFEDRLDDVEVKLSGDPLSGAKYRFTCNNCGSKGWIAVRVMCTKCKRETYLGWHPKE